MGNDITWKVWEGLDGFDIERARSGEKVVIRDGGHTFGTVPVSIVRSPHTGTDQVLYWNESGPAVGSTAYTSNVRMAPKEPEYRTVYLNVHEDGKYIAVHESEESAKIGKDYDDTIPTVLVRLVKDGKTWKVEASK